VPSEDELDELLRALASQHRRDILRQIWDRERGAGELAAHLGLAAPSVSEHLKVLRKSGLVEMRVAGTYRLYRASPRRMRELGRLLEHEFPVTADAYEHSAIPSPTPEESS
jgi:DNA-binding transcriptional ArsR family regulator